MPLLALINQKTVEIKPTSPFAFDPTFHKPDHFTSGDNYWESGTRWQTWNFKDNCYSSPYLLAKITSQRFNG